eukprot:COSAG04_NODE_412_length_14743_cov_74.925294_5_plen_277_part_00
MSALDVANNLMDTEHQAGLTAAGTRDFERTALGGKETAEGLRDDVTSDVGELSTAKGVYGAAVAMKGVYGAGGVRSFAQREGARLGKAAATAVGRGRVNLGGAAEAAPTDPGRAAFLEAGGTVDSVHTVDPEPLAESGGAAVEEAATGAEKVVSKLKLAGRALGAAGGVFDTVDDIIHGGVVGDNRAEKWGNGLTIAGTVLDFVPGMEWLGTGLNAVGAYEGLKGESQASGAQATANDRAMASINRPSPAVHSWSQMGLVSSLAPDAVHQMADAAH